MKNWETPDAPNMAHEAFLRMWIIRGKLGDGPVGQSLEPGHPW